MIESSIDIADGIANLQLFQCIVDYINKKTFLSKSFALLLKTKISNTKESHK